MWTFATLPVAILEGIRVAWYTANGLGTRLGDTIDFASMMRRRLNAKQSIRALSQNSETLTLLEVKAALVGQLGSCNCFATNSKGTGRSFKDQFNQLNTYV